MRIINPCLDEDFHIHSITFSDGFNSIDEIVKYAGEIGLKKIAITDHSQASLDYYKVAKKTFRPIVNRWRNVHNNVKVVFGVEGDILNDEGDVCVDIDGFKSDFVILSAHPNVYKCSKQSINDAYIAAIQRHHKKLACIGHPCMKYFSEFLDVSKLVSVANEFNVPLEFNCGNLVRDNTDLKKLNVLLRESARVMVNSDAHTLYDLKTNRTEGFRYLLNSGFQ